MVIPAIVFYSFGRAVQRVSWWRIILWTLPMLVNIRLVSNMNNITSNIITKMYLKDCGEKVVIQSMRDQSFNYRRVVNISDLKKTDTIKAGELFEQLSQSTIHDINAYQNHIPLEVKGNSLLLRKNDCNKASDKQILKAVIQGISIDTSNSINTRDKLRKEMSQSNDDYEYIQKPMILDI